MLLLRRSGEEETARLFFEFERGLLEGLLAAAGCGAAGAGGNKEPSISGGKQTQGGKGRLLGSAVGIAGPIEHAA